ncbi:MAG: hypothetical protein JXR79_01000 [Nitrospirae bacterium]|nr:hypothetical protein [Nitrospirota bacterium]
MLSQLIFSVTRDRLQSPQNGLSRSADKTSPYLDSDFMCRVIMETSMIADIRVVAFAGGEPLLKKDELLGAIRFSAGKGLWTKLITNSYWADTPDNAVLMLSELKSSGLSEINLCSDDLQQGNVAIENIKNAFWSARQLNLPTLIINRRSKNSRVSIEHISQHLGVRLVRFDPEKNNPQHDVYTSSISAPIGLSSEWLNHEKQAGNMTDGYTWKTPCSSVLRSLVISPEGEIRICCGMIEQALPELSYGLFGSRALTQILCEANCDLLANWLALEEPYGLMQYVKSKAPDLMFQDQYVNHCHLCKDLLMRKEVRFILKSCDEEKSDAISLKRSLLEAVRNEQ